MEEKQLRMATAPLQASPTAIYPMPTPPKLQGLHPEGPPATWSPGVLASSGTDTGPGATGSWAGSCLLLGHRHPGVLVKGRCLFVFWSPEVSLQEAKTLQGSFPPPEAPSFLLKFTL
jgi:hypothetical protein